MNCNFTWYILCNYKKWWYLKDVEDEQMIHVQHMLLNGRIMVFNATFNNISVISWRSVLLVEETGVHGSRNPPTCRKSLTNFITYCGIEYTSPKTGYDHDHDGPLDGKINIFFKKGRYSTILCQWWKISYIFLWTWKFLHCI
jgi:hypothetical protein